MNVTWKYIRAFKSHPESVGETYVTHLLFALRFSGLLAFAAFAAVMHAFIPPIFETTASQIVKNLNDGLRNRAKQ